MSQGSLAGQQQSCLRCSLWRSSKSQAPSSKEIPNRKFQFCFTGGFDIWQLELVWDLGLGTLGFISNTDADLPLQVRLRRIVVAAVSDRRFLTTRLNQAGSLPRYQADSARACTA